ncbi:MAG: hypothetical protein ACLBM1_12970 [Cuspidothrix sp.]
MQIDENRIVSFICHGYTVGINLNYVTHYIIREEFVELFVIGQQFPIAVPFCTALNDLLTTMAICLYSDIEY